MKIAFGCDHGGFPAKAEIMAHLKEKGIDILDFGTFSEESCNYPVFAFKAAEAVSQGQAGHGLFVCSAGEGVCLCAPQGRGVRAGSGYNDEVSRLLVEHNHANVITFGAKFMGIKDILRRIDIFLEAVPAEGRHSVRVSMIEEYEKR